jgi:hypothetical protein
MSKDDPNNTEREGRILQFRPRSPSRVEAFSNLSSDHSPISDLSKFAQSGNRDDYAHRMKVNALAVLFLAVLVGGGIWIVDTMAQQRNNQDCALSGRRNCAANVIPIPLR